MTASILCALPGQVSAIMNSDLCKNGWRHLIQMEAQLKLPTLQSKLIVEEYDIDEEVTERLEFSYKTFV